MPVIRSEKVHRNMVSFHNGIYDIIVETSFVFYMRCGTEPFGCSSAGLELEEL